MPDYTNWNVGGMSFNEVLTLAVRDLSENGYNSTERVVYWMGQLRLAAVRSMVPYSTLMTTLGRMLQGTYHKLVERAGVLRMHPGVHRFTLESIKPRLRAELDRRIAASASLIKLNRDQAVETTLRRFSGWSTSIPPGGSEAVDKKDVKENISKPLRSLPFVERRVAVDQGHKLASNISELLATDTGAIAAVWHSNWRQANYDYREDHKERDKVIYLVRGSWADEKGYVKLDGSLYTDQITKPGEEVFCRCHYSWVTSLNRLPDGMLTRKGLEARESAKMALAG